MRNEYMNSQHFLALTGRFPTSPGVYIMKNTQGTPIYIGKASNLKSRVRSYFLDTHADRHQIPFMLRRLHSIDWIATSNDTEALILEANLVRAHKPAFNVELKDDKHFPYLKVTLNEPFPRLIVTRRVVKDGSRYFGPYTEVRAMRRIMNFAHRIFKLRDCKKKLPLAKPIRPCINYEMGRCSGACANKISQQAYRDNVDMLLKFLSGKRKDLIGELTGRMLRASDRLAFEEAASLRDQIKLMQSASGMQRVDLKLADVDCDVFGLFEGDRNLCLTVLQFREGLMMGTRHFVIEKATWLHNGTSHDDVVVQFYAGADMELPAEILIPDSDVFNRDLLELWATGQAGHKVAIFKPQKGVRKSLIELAMSNGKLYLAQKTPEDPRQDIEDLQKVCNLPRTPMNIEAFDISNLGENYAVAGMVRFGNGKPDKSLYRSYKIKTVEGQNDFAMMMEAVTRRLERLHREEKPFPDLLLIDGGKGQLGAAMHPLQAYENPPMIVSLAKKEELIHSPYLPQPVRLNETHPARRLVQRIRDEVHRRAITFHRSSRGRQFRRSRLESIAGVGSARARALLTTFGSVQKVQAAAVEHIAQVPGISDELAGRIHQALANGV
ncbi:MAG: excinuclease ABC subunit UvrC [Chitinivibrionales bacterium]|nr:excinuclease ABC subunit UvrC [Chitinivibrionales bacterium]